MNRRILGIVTCSIWSIFSFSLGWDWAAGDGVTGRVVHCFHSEPTKIIVSYETHPPHLFNNWNILKRTYGASSTPSQLLTQLFVNDFLLKVATYFEDSWNLKINEENINLLYSSLISISTSCTEKNDLYLTDQPIFHLRAVQATRIPPPAVQATRIPPPAVQATRIPPPAVQATRNDAPRGSPAWQLRLLASNSPPDNYISYGTSASWIMRYTANNNFWEKSSFGKIFFQTYTHRYINETNYRNNR